MVPFSVRSKGVLGSVGMPVYCDSANPDGASYDSNNCPTPAFFGTSFRSWNRRHDSCVPYPCRHTRSTCYTHDDNANTLAYKHTHTDRQTYRGSGAGDDAG